MIASAPRAEQSEFLQSLSADALRGLPYLFEFWAMEHQLPPAGDWRTWLILGGRGAGKTRAGAEWVRSRVEGSRPEDKGLCHRIALVGETYDQARDVMVLGESGIIGCTPPDRRPRWEGSRRRLVWPNGAEAHVYSAQDFEGLRGPQFDGAWADELAKWPRAQEAWDMLSFAVRLGEARKLVTTTPRDVGALKRLMKSPHTVMTHATTMANRANLADAFLEEMEARFSGTTLGAQELEGILVTDVEGSLWTTATIERARVDTVPEFDRVVVAVDPPVSGHAKSDACGIVAVGAVLKGARTERTAYVLEDATVQGVSPLEWARVAIETMHRHGADRMVVETNQGGNLVETVVRQIDDTVSFKSVRATRSKEVRAEPVAALYEQGRVRHLRGLGELETEMRRMTTSGYAERGSSPDRVDALVWAVTELLLDKGGVAATPHVRTLGY